MIFMGYRTDIPNILPLIDILVNPSNEEGFGISLLEGMAMEKPVIATSVGGIKEIVENGVTGILIPSRDQQQFATAVIELAENKEKQALMGKSGKERANKYFTIERMLESIDSLYQELTHSRELYQ